MAELQISVGASDSGALPQTWNSDFHFLQTFDRCYTEPSHPSMKGLQWFTDGFFLMFFWSIFLLSAFPNWEPSVYIWGLEAIGAISGEVLGSLAISETCSVAELKRRLTVAHHWPGAVPWTVGDWKLTEIREWYNTIYKTNMTYYSIYYIYTNIQYRQYTIELDVHLPTYVYNILYIHSMMILLCYIIIC